jgi:hypothetical protein
MYFTYFANILNEVLHGFAVDCESDLGTSRSSLIKLFKKALARDHEQSVDVSSFSLEEAQFLLKCSHLCLKEIEEWEFHTRFGIRRETAIEINRLLSNYIESQSKD